LPFPVQGGFQLFHRAPDKFGGPTGRNEPTGLVMAILPELTSQVGAGSAGRITLGKGIARRESHTTAVEYQPALGTIGDGCSGEEEESGPKESAEGKGHGGGHRRKRESTSEEVVVLGTNAVWRKKRKYTNTMVDAVLLFF